LQTSWWKFQIRHRSAHIVAGLALAGVGAVLAQAMLPAPASTELPEPDLRHESFLTYFSARDAPQRIEHTVMLVDFPPHSWTEVHAPGGDIYNTVIDGEISTRVDNVTEQHYVTGDAFVEASGEWITIGNPTDMDARVIATALLPVQASMAVSRRGFMGDPYKEFRADFRGLETAASAAGPTIVQRSSSTTDLPDGAFAVVQRMVHLEPGEWTPGSVADGPALALVSSGEVTTLRGAEVDGFTPGQMWTIAPGVRHSEGNSGDLPVDLVFSELVPQ
jgi:quercetin dioxygenase-like cupin family protein